MTIHLVHFDLSEFACKCGECGSDGSEMQPEFLYKLDDLRERCGFPFIVTSGYRCPAYNARISSTGENGPHTTGEAADIAAAFGPAYKLVQQAFFDGIFTGIGINQKGASTSRFVHLDTLNPGDNSRPRVWTY